jgi:hypothetical protein
MGHSQPRSSARCAMSLRYCIPSQEMQATAL